MGNRESNDQQPANYGYFSVLTDILNKYSTNKNKQQPLSFAVAKDLISKHGENNSKDALTQAFTCAESILSKIFMLQLQEQNALVLSNFKEREMDFGMDYGDLIDFSSLDNSFVVSLVFSVGLHRLQQIEVPSILAGLATSQLQFSSEIRLVFKIELA